MPKDGRGSRSSESALVSVSLPPLLPGRGPGTALRLRPPTPPPRPESSLPTPPHSSPVGPQDPPPLLHLPPSLSALDSPITLTSPRTASSRTQNLYVDTPFGGGAPNPNETTPPVTRPVKRTPQRTSKTQSCTSCHSVITSQPKADKSTAVLVTSSGGADQQSIICVRCGRCRCDACRTPHALPEVWLCDNSCLCSLESSLDTLSCMCCVKAAFYHCGERLDQEIDKEDSWVDSPCSCSHTKWWLRWGCLGLMSLPLPCLLCYPLLWGLAKGAESCYQTATSRGCRCPDTSRQSCPENTRQSDRCPDPNRQSCPDTSRLSDRCPDSLTSSPSSVSTSPSTDSQKRLLG